MNGKNAIDAQTKLVLIIALVIAAAASFYFLGYKPLKEQEAQLRSEISETEKKIETEQKKISGINKRKEEIADGRTSGSAVEVYDNSNAEWAAVSEVMKRYATSYSLSFGSSKSDDGVYVRRGMNISFTAADYTTAKQIIAELAASRYRNIISDIKLTSTGSKGSAGFAGFNADNPVQGSVSITFFETVNGAEDTTGLKMNSKK